MKFSILLICALLVTFSASSPLPQSVSDEYVKFSANIYKQLLKSHPRNFLVCPLSVQTVLALAHNGAKGKTANEISSALHLPENKQAVLEIFQDLSQKLKANEHYELDNANKIYVKQDFEINEDFKKAAEDAFQSEIENIDFEENSDAASTMNKWVEEKTHDKIKNLISENDLDKDTRLVLINALYFHGKWATQFNKRHTSKKSFYVSNDKETKVDMMEITQNFKYYENPDLNAKFLEMPYKGGDITMTFILPNEVGGLSSLEDKIEDVLKTPKYNRRKVHVQIPKFKVESTIDFNKVLKMLGVVDAFSDNADFSGIGARAEPLKISKIVQKTFIEVEEKGTTAAAATAGLVAYVRSGHHFIQRPLEFNANHPFIYYLKSPAGILFIGRYMEG